MRIVVFGASGNCGSHFVRLAADRGHAVTAVVRPNTMYQPPGTVALARGDVLDASFVSGIMAGHNAVMSGLGIRYQHPWAVRGSADDFISRATGHIVTAMKESAVSRISVISAAGVGDSRPHANFAIRILIATSNVGVAYADLERVEHLLARSDLDWQAVRPTTLTHGRERPVRVTNRYSMWESIPRRSVAAFILSELEKPSFAFRTPMVTGA